MTNTKPACIKLGGWSWCVDAKGQCLSFLGDQANFAAAVNVLADLSEQHMSQLAVVVEYIENMDDAQASAELLTRPSSN
jgi:hypothetical protein